MVYGGVGSPLTSEGRDEVNRGLFLRLGTKIDRELRTFDGTISALSASPTLKHVALLQHLWPAPGEELSPELSEFYSPDLNLVHVLHILDIDTWESIVTLPGVGRFSWSPDGSELAVIRGLPVEGPGDLRYPRVERVALDGAVTPVEGVLSWELNWSESDGKLRVLSSEGLGKKVVVAFDFLRGQQEREDGSGPERSPSGRFSLGGKGEASLLTIEDLAEIRSPDSLSRLLTRVSDTQIGPVGWAGPDLLVGRLNESSTVVLDLAGDRVAKIPGLPCHALTDGRILVLDEEVFRVVETSLMQWLPVPP